MIGIKQVIVAVLKETLTISGWILLLGMAAPYTYASGNNHPVSSAVKAEENIIAELYNHIDFGSHAKLRQAVFIKAYTGYLHLRHNNYLSEEKSILSVCDFSLSANKPRLWVIDLDAKKVLFNTLVAHGEGTGEEYAGAFSNLPDSHQSSLGFYITGDTYMGNNGYSLRLAGMDTGYNDRAMDRAIVMHGAAYVSERFIRANRRIGRSWGCPAVPVEFSRPVINTVKDSTCLFVFYQNQEYLAGSRWLKSGIPVPGAGNGLPFTITPAGNLEIPGSNGTMEPPTGASSGKIPRGDTGFRQNNALH